MGINPKILDKIIYECGNDAKSRGILQEMLVMENDKIPNLKDVYVAIIESHVKESGGNED